MLKNLNSEDDISVIIRNKNEERWIGHAIQSVIERLAKPEIIVVDNHSTDNSIAIVKHFIQDPLLNFERSANYTKIKIETIDDYTPGKALNIGAKKATRNYILVLSAHCILKNIDFDDLKKKLEKYVAVFGNQNPIWNGKKISKRYIWSHFGDSPVENMYSEQEKRFFFHNAISIFKKETLVQDPFDEFLLGKEDRYWINERISKKKKSLYDPKLSVDHFYTADGNTWKGIG
jgi:rhamnosyltransferase